MIFQKQIKHIIGLASLAATRVSAWLSNLLPGPKRPKPYQTLIVQNDLPKQLKDRILYVVVDDGFSEQAAMLCPCGCTNILHLNLNPDDRPCWKVSQHIDGTSTLFPSVNRLKGCRSHFWFREGRVDWC